MHRPSILQTAVPALADAAAVDFASRVSAAFAQRREAAGGAPPDVLVQVMSGAGFLAYGTLCHLTMLAAGRGGGSPGSSGSHACALPHRLLAEPRAAAALAAMPKVMAATRGVVVDSAPPPFQPGIWSRGFLAALLSTEAYGLERRHPLALRAAHELTERYTSLPSVALRMREVRAAWAAAVPPCPQLYLYSTIDPVRACVLENRFERECVCAFVDWFCVRVWGEGHATSRDVRPALVSMP